MPRKLMVAGNWKMNNTVGQALDLVGDLSKKLTDIHRCDVVVAPPFTALHAVAGLVHQNHVTIQLAAQNVHWEASGAYTGEVSPMMLKEAGCKWVILGHSERRQYFGETDETVNKRVKAAQSLGNLYPIVCVGETLEEREAGETFAVLDRQVAGALDGLAAEEMTNVVVAYEPVWAIGTGKTATPEMADEAHARIREKLAALFGPSVGEATRILYGGSMKPDNAKELLSCPNIDGGLIGGASLKASDFIAIVDAALAASA